MQQQQLPALMAWNRTDQNTHATRTTNYTMQAKFTLATTSIRSMLFGLKAAARLAGQQSNTDYSEHVEQLLCNTCIKGIIPLVM